MKRLVTVTILVVFLVVSVLFGLSDRGVSVADANTPDNEITTAQTEAGNSSASASIVITMYIFPNE